MSLGTIRPASAAIRRFLVHCGGSLTIPAIFLFAVLMGVGGLAIDLQRFYGVHGQMQAYVDDEALAGAAELDGQTNAVTRAKNAIVGDKRLVTGTGWQSFATDTSLGVQKITFLSKLDTDPGPLGNTPATNDVVLCTYSSADGFASPSCSAGLTLADADGKARFVEVVAEPRTVSYVVLPIANAIGQIFTAKQLTPTVALRATAGFKESICDINPMMICNPTEPANNTDVNYPYTPVIGQQILVRAGQGGGKWAPGDFGWLSIPNDAGASKCANGSGKKQDLGCVLGLVNPLTQCINNGDISVDPGQDTQTADGLNVRFDIYPTNKKLGPADKVDKDADFAPSVNVTKGICNITTDKKTGVTTCDYSGTFTCPATNKFDVTSKVTSMNGAGPVKMPRDNQWCDANGNCVATPDSTHRFGNADWDRAGYWKSNHGGDPLPITLTNATRYDVYRHEIECASGAITTGCSAHDGIPDFSGNGGENGNHTASGNGKYCSSKAGVDTPKRDRRLLYVAVVNCVATGLKGSSKSGVTAVAYLKVFLTEPVGFKADGTWDGTGAAKDVYGEVVDVITRNDPANLLRVYPVLYR